MSPIPMPDPGLLASGRVHEITGSGRRTFACALAGQLDGPVIWVQGHSAPALYPPGIAAFFDPGRLILARPKGKIEMLQVVEEALRAATAPLVVAELEDAPDLTASRRLQLAAGTGGGRGLCLVPDRQLRSNAAETRWMCRPVPGQGAQDWEIVKNKRGKLGRWHVTCEDGQFIAAAVVAEPV